MGLRRLTVLVGRLRAAGRTAADPRTYSEMPAQLRVALPILGAFSRYVAHHFAKDRCAQMAGGLSYTTLLAIVPLTAVGLAVFAAFPVFGGVTDQLQDIIFQHFVPAAGVVIQEHLQQFVDQASRLTLPGVVFLFVTALLLIATIEQTFNVIWRAPKRDNRLLRFMVYWAVLTLGPLLIGASLAATSYVATLEFFEHAAGPEGLNSLVLGVMPFASAVLAFTLLYTVVPNRSVPLRYALGGALLAGVLFELSKMGFAAYVTRFPTYELIYGALAAIPIFLVWVYIAWLVILLGAEVAYCLQTFRYAGRGDLDEEDAGLLAAYRVLAHLHGAHHRGGGLPLRTLAAREPAFGESALAPVLERLAALSLVQRTDRGDWVLSRDLSAFTLRDLYRRSGFRIPDQVALAPTDAWNRTLSRVLGAANRGLDQALDVPLAQLYADPGRDAPALAETPPARGAAGD